MPSERETHDWDPSLIQYLFPMLRLSQLIGFGTWLLPFHCNGSTKQGWKACPLDHLRLLNSIKAWNQKTFFSHWRYRNGPSPQRDKWGTPQNTCWDGMSSLSSKQSSHTRWCSCTIHAAAHPLLALIHSVTCILLSWLVLAPSLQLVSSVFERILVLKNF